MTKRITPDGFAEPMGAYSHAITVDLGTKTMVLVTGQLPIDGDGKPVAPDDIEKQTRAVFENIKTVLASAGATIDDVVKAQVFITDTDDFKTVSQVRNEYFANARPVSTLVEISRTVMEGCNIEIEVMAMIDNSPR